MKKTRKYILYFISFLFITVPIIIRSSLGKQAAFGGWDDVNEMYPAFVYTKHFFEEIVTNLSHGKFAIPMIGYTLGMGEDIIGVLNWFGFCDPVYFVFIFFDDAYLPYVFTVILYLKIFLGGISFMLMCSEIDNSKEDFAYVIGALVYSFSGFTLHCNLFITFTHAMYCIPLMIYGAEKKIEKDKKGILLFSTCLFALCGFFFLYIGSIALGIYVLYKLIKQKTNIRKGLNIIINLLVEYFIGLGLASIFLFPSIYSFLTSNRTGVTSTNHSFFSLELLINLFKNIFIPQYNSSFQVFSFVSFGVICILLLLTSYSHLHQKCNLVILSVLTAMPIVNCIMSGFGEAYDRWVIVVALYVAFLVTQIHEELLQLNFIQKMTITAVLFILVYFGKKGQEVELIDNRRYYITLVAYFVIWLTIITLNILNQKWNSTFFSKIYSTILLLICLYTIHISWAENYLDKPIECVQQRNIVQELLSDDNNFYRVDNAVTYLPPGNYPNMAFLQNYHGIADYFSTQNKHFVNTMQLWNVSPQITGKIIYRGLDNRALLETLCGVKYLIFPKNEVVRIPYGFIYEKETADGEWLLYKNSEFLPLIYGYQSVLDDSLINHYDGYSIQSIISKYACVDEYNGKLKEKNRITETAEQCIEKSCYINKLESITVSSGDEISLNIELLPTCENYILIKHLDVKNEFELYENDTLITKAIVSPEYNNGYVGLNLGCVDDKTTNHYTLKIQADDQIEISSINFDYKNYHNIISDLRINISELNVDINNISAQLSLEEPRMVCIAMPYSTGWSAKVDGKKADTFLVNNMFLGIEVDEGQHEIVLSYCTPFMKLALVITLLSLICAIMYLRSKRKIQK